MSYCVNCGVELADSEKICPLCQTEVINPRAPWKDPLDIPYPPVMDRLMHRIDRRYLAALISTFMLIPIAVVLISDWLRDGLSWSLYVVGAAALLEVWFILPLMTKRYHQISFLALDSVAATLYIWAIERISGGEWFLPLGLPISAALSATVLLMAFLFRRGRGRDFLVRLIIILSCIGFLAIVVEISSDLYLTGQVYLTWSLFVLSPCVFTVAALLILEEKHSLKEEIHKRIFY